MTVLLALALLAEIVFGPLDEYRRRTICNPRECQPLFECFGCPPPNDPRPLVHVRVDGASCLRPVVNEDRTIISYEQSVVSGTGVWIAEWASTVAVFPDDPGDSSCLDESGNWLIPLSQVKRI